MITMARVNLRMENVSVNLAGRDVGVINHAYREPMAISVSKNVHAQKVSHVTISAETVSVPRDIQARAVNIPVHLAHLDLNVEVHARADKTLSVTT